MLENVFSQMRYRALICSAVGLVACLMGVSRLHAADEPAGGGRQGDDLKPTIEEMDAIREGVEQFEREIRIDGKEGGILIVAEYAVFTSNWQNRNPTMPAASATTVKLTGRASPNSDQRLNHAYLNFVPDGEKLRPPKFSPEVGRIELFFHRSHLPTVLASLTDHEEAYCWVGQFEGQIYGDLHVSRRLSAPHRSMPAK